MVGASGRTIELTGGRGGGRVSTDFFADFFLEAARVQKDYAGPHPDSQKGTAANTGAQFQQNHKTGKINKNASEMVPKANAGCGQNAH